MDHDVSSRIQMQLACPFTVSRVWIRDLQRQMCNAVCVPAYDGVDAFRRFIVALSPLCVAWAAIKPDVVHPQLFTTGIQSHRVRRLNHNDAVGVGRRLNWSLRSNGGAKICDEKE